MFALAAAAVLPGGVGDAELTPGWVLVDGGRIADVGSGAPPESVPTVDLGDRVLAPGFLDLHVHGGAGAEVNGADPDAVARSVLDIARFHVRHGTTGLLATTVSDTPERLVAAVRGIGVAVGSGGGGSDAATVLGAHLEGPWVAAEMAGAQNPAVLRLPDLPELQSLLDAAPGTLRMVTIAPELPGALDVIRAAADAGVVMSVGHTAATADQTVVAFAAGARHATHLFNRMPPLGHRDPGPVGVALTDPRVTVEVIADGIHLHPDVLALVGAAAGERVVAVTDAMPAAGLQPGRYELGGLQVDVDSERAVLADRPDTLAGSVLTMDRAVRTLVAAGLSRRAAVAAATSIPAGCLGEGRKGRLAAGADADLVVLSAELAVEATVVGGRAVHDPSGLLAGAA